MAIFIINSKEATMAMKENQLENLLKKILSDVIGCYSKNAYPT